MNEESLKERMRRILKETVEFYGADPQGRRAVKPIDANNAEETCVYRTEDGRRCAIGRLVNDEEAQILADAASGVGGSSVRGILTRRPVSETVLAAQEIIRGLALPVSFAMHLQELHDHPENWKYDGISEGGRVEVADLERTIDTGEYELEGVA